MENEQIEIVVNKNIGKRVKSIALTLNIPEPQLFEQILCFGLGAYLTQGEQAGQKAGRNDGISRSDKQTKELHYVS
jgi:hypothetical protein